MKKLFSFLLAAAMLFSLVACAPSGGEPSTSPSIAPTSSPTQTPTPPVETDPPLEPITLNVAYMPNYAALWAVTTGIKQGYFEEQGITINLYEFADGPTEIAAMESGTIDVSYIGPGAHKLCSTGNASVFLLQQLGNADSVIGLKSRGVNSLADLKGKTVAYSSGTSSETILKLALSSVDLTMDDIEAYDMDTSNMVTAMISGSVDACATWSPNSLKILSELGDDAIKFCSNVDFKDVSVSPASWVCTPAYAEENADVLVRFIKALYKAMDYGSQETNFGNVATWVAEQCATDYDSAFDQRGDGAWYTGEQVIAEAKDGTMVAYYKLQQDAFVRDGALEEGKYLDVNEFVLTDLMIEAGDLYR